MIREVSQATVEISGDFADPAFANAVLKHNLARGTVEAHEFGPEATSGEAVFVPASADADEDDGYVMAFVHNPNRGAADLVILAAQLAPAEMERVRSELTAYKQFAALPDRSWR